MDFDMSSCSFSDSEGADPTKAEKMGKLRLENEELRQTNDQMKESIDSLQNQLKQAIQASTSIDMLRKQLLLVQGKLTEATERNEVLSQKLAAAQKEPANTGQLNELRALVHKLETQLEDADMRFLKLKKEKSELVSTCKKQKELLDEATATAMHMKHKKKKAQKQQLKEQEYYEQIEAKANQTELEILRVTGENKRLQQEIEDLKVELQSSAASIHDLTSANTALKSENQKLLGAFTALEEQITQQSNEIVACHQERQMVTEMLRKMHVYVCASESLNDQLQTEVNDLNLKLKVKPQLNPDSDQFDITSLDISFPGELGTKCRHILEMKQYKPVQRIQTILNTLSNEITENEAAIHEKNQEIASSARALEKKESDSQKTIGILKALLMELKNLAVTEAAIDKCADCDADPAFLKFVAEKCILSTESSGNDTIPADFLSIDDISTRKQIVEREIRPDGEAMSLFVAQFLANTVLRRQLQKVLAVLPKKEEMSRLLKDLKCDSVQELIGYVGACQSELMKLKKQNTQLQKECKRAKKQQQQNTSDMSFKAQISRMQLQNDELQNELDLLQMRNQVLNNELSVTRQEDSKPREPVVVDPRIQELESLLSQKEEEIAQLKRDLDGSKRKTRETIEKMSSKQSKREKALLEEVETLTTRASELELKVAKKSKRHKLAIKEILRQNEQQVSDISCEYAQSKASYEAVIKGMEEKMGNARELSQKLMSTVSEKEKVNQRLAEENSQLRLAQKALEIKLIKLQETSQKERQVLLGQLSATKMSCQSQIQEADKASKKQAETKIQEIYGQVTAELSDFYRIGHESLDDESFKQVLVLVKRDLERLQIFQKQGVRIL